MKPCSLSAFAVNVYMLSLLCSLSSTITTRHWAPEEKLLLLLLSTATTGFRSATAVEAKIGSTERNRAAILRLAREGWAERADNGYT